MVDISFRFDMKRKMTVLYGLPQEFEAHMRTNIQWIVCIVTNIGEFVNF